MIKKSNQADGNYNPENKIVRFRLSNYKLNLSAGASNNNYLSDNAFSVAKFASLDLFLPEKSKTFFKYLVIFFKNKKVMMIKMITKNVATAGWQIIKYKVPATVISSVTLAMELVMGSGEAFIIARLVAFVR